MEELQAIIAKMQSNGESDESIGRIIQEYRKRNPDVDLTLPEPGKTLDPVNVEANAGSNNTVSNLGPGFGGFQKKAKVFSAAFQALAGIAEDTDTGKSIIQKAQFPVSLAKSGYEFFAENLSEAFVGATDTLLNIRSQQLVESDKITKEQRDQLLDASAEEFFDPILDVTRGVGDVLRSADQTIDEVLYEDATTTATEDLLSGKIKDGSLKIADGVIEAIPSIAAAIYGGPIGYATIFSSASGGAYKSKIEVSPSKRGDAGTFATALAQGGVELISETVTRGILKGFGGTALEKVAPKAAKNLYKNLTKTLTGRIFTGANLEGLSEVAAQETNRYIDKLWDDENAFGYKDENGNYDWGNIIYRASDTYMISSIIGGGLASASKTPQAKIYTEQRLSPNAVKKKTLETINKISKLEKEYDNNPNDLILDEILELQQSVIDNKVLNEKVLNSFDNTELEEYAITKVKIAKAKEGLNKIKDTETKDVIEARIQKEESKLDNIYNDKLSQLIKILEKPIKPEGVLMSDFGVVSAADKLRRVALDKVTQKKISNDVQKIYEEQGEAGALDIIEKFRPITNKLVRKRRDAPNYDEQLLRDEIETGERGIFDLIRSYKPDSGVPLSGYINKFLKARAIEASNRVLGKEFTQDVTEIKESKIDLDDTTQETLDFVRTEPKAKEQLRDVAGITKESVQTDAQQILKGKLPGIIEKSGRDKNEILTAINKASQLKIADNVLEEMGGNFNNKEEQNSRFITFMDVNFDAVIKAIPNSIKNKLPLFEAKQVDRESMKEGDEAGKGVFEYKNPGRQEFIDYYTKTDTSKNPASELNKLRAKKKKLADILAQEIGKDAIAEVLSDPNIQKEFLERQELLGKEIPKAPIPKLLQRIDRVIKILEKPIAPKNTLRSDFGSVEFLDKVRQITLSLLKKIRKFLADGLSFDASKEEAFNEIGKELNLSKRQAEVFKKSASPNITPKNIENNNTEEKLSEAYKKTILTVTNDAILSDTQYLKSVINDKNLTDNQKTQILKDFFGGHAQVYQKARSTKKDTQKSVWEGVKASDAFGYWKKELGPKLKTLGFGIVRKGAGQSISFKGEPLFNVIGRPGQINQDSNIRKKYYVKIKQSNGKSKTVFNDKTAPEYYKASGKYYTDQIQELDAQSEKNINYVIDGMETRFTLYGKQEVVDFIRAQNTYSDSPLRLISKIKSYEISNKSKGPHVYDHNSPIEFISNKIYEVINSTNNIQEILDKTRKILESSEVNLITKETNNKLNKLGRRSVGNKKTRLIGAVNPKNLIEIRRPRQKIKEETDKVDLNKDFNDILEQKTGIASEERYTKAKAEIKGKGKGKFDYIGIPPSAQDFIGLLYKTLSKGKEGDTQLAWYKKNLLDPFAKAMIDVSNYRVTLSSNYKGIKREGGITSEILQKKLPDGFFTTEQALRAYIWNKQGVEIEGLEKDSPDLKQLVKYIKKDSKLAMFANRLISINKKNKYPEPDKNWLVGTITTDLLKSINTNVRKDALTQWKSNVDAIFSEANMNKLESAFGKGYRSALDNMLKRMESGRNRGYPGDQLTGRFIDWLNGSVGAIMFFNMRSAVLQTISSVNFVNLSDNNIFKASKAFANQPQYWKDVFKLMNSDFLVERRNGLKINVNEADIAEIAAESDNKAKAFVNKLLKLGFLPTQIADSFAISTGGATFYRNRLQSYIKKGFSENKAEEKAFVDFREITEENQQSSRPDRISQQQAGPLGRIILAFANTPAQYARIIQKAASDLKNKRGDTKTSISKIIYYGAVQNVIFNAMQQALFALAFGDEEPDDEKEAEKYGNIANGMIDSLLRGVGFAGAAVSTVKNAIIKIAKDGNKQDIAIDLINISPPISSKIRKVRSAGRTFDWNKKEIAEKGLSLDNPAAMAIGQIVSATTNVPLDRGIRKLTNIKDALDSENEEWMRIANALGWAKWELEWEQDKRKKKKTPKKQKQSFNKLKF